MVFLFDNIENLKILSVLHRPNKPYVKKENRKTHSFFIRVRGAVEYDFCGRKMLAREGELMFMPKGASYTARTLAEGTMYTAIHFEGDFAVEPRPGVYSLESFPEADYMASCLSDLWNFGTQAERYRCVSLVYSLLAHLSATENAGYAERNKFRIIDPAADYLKAHIYDSDLKIHKLPRLCGISETYFRQIFISRFGTAPQSYVLSKRLAHAKSIISSGDFNSIGEVALAVGFRDPLYFSKVFRKAYGMPPSGMNKD